jgi:hypothetical protein
MKSLMIFFCAGIILSSSGVWPFQLDSPRQNGENHAKYQQKDAGPSLSIPKQPDNSGQGKGAQHAADGEPKAVRITELPPNDTWYMAYVTATVALVFVGAGGVIAALWTLATIRRQTNWLSSSERAWVMAELQWPARLGHIVEGASSTGESSTNIEIMLLSRNEGKTPAWIMEKYVRCEIASAIPDAPRPYPPPREQDLHILGPEPLGVGKESSLTGQVQCNGLLRPNLILLVDALLDTGMWRERIAKLGSDIRWTPLHISTALWEAKTSIRH